MYASAKKTGVVHGTQSVILSKNDIRYMRQRDMSANDTSWKILWWGNHHDEALIERKALIELLRRGVACGKHAFHGSSFAGTPGRRAYNAVAARGGGRGELLWPVGRGDCAAGRFSKRGDGVV